MAIVIGAATTVSFAGACAVSANWSYNPNTQRLFCIGEWTPSEERTYFRPTQTLNLTIYAPGPDYDTSPTQGCEDANTISASVSPAACGANIDGVDGSWWVQSYNFSKEDATMPGQESWTLIKWKDVPAPGGGTFVEPTYIMRGISEGQATDNAGVNFTGSTTSTSTGNVSAGGFGKADVLTVGVVSSVGGGTSAEGETGQGSASMPYTPLYI